MSIIQTLAARSGRLVSLDFGARGGGRRLMKPRRKSASPRSRLVIVGGAIVVAYSVIFGKLVYYAEQAGIDISSIPPGPSMMASRPEIDDRNGQVLATDIRTVSMFAEPIKIVDVDDAVEKLSSSVSRSRPQDRCMSALQQALAFRLAEAAAVAEAAERGAEARHSGDRLPAGGEAVLSGRALRRIFSATSISTITALPGWRNISTSRGFRRWHLPD
jgi:cell division protein FtsI/penicillin-binding protein 2